EKVEPGTTIEDEVVVLPHRAPPDLRREARIVERCDRSRDARGIQALAALLWGGTGDHVAKNEPPGAQRPAVLRDHEVHAGDPLPGCEHERLCRIGPIERLALVSTRPGPLAR